MAIIAKSSGGNFIPAPSGAHAAVAVDVIDLGMLKVSFGGKEQTKHKIRIAWQISEVMADNKPFLVQKQYTLSLHEKANLRKDLESWRGVAFTDSELEGFDVETIIGVPCLLNVMQETKAGKTYANVKTIMRLPRGMEPVKIRDYVRVKDRTPEQVAQEAPDDPSDGGYFPSDDDVPF